MVTNWNYLSYNGTVVIREMFMHYIGNDVHLINLITEDSLDPLETRPISQEATQKILNRTHTIKDFMDKLREATFRKDSLELYKTSGDTQIPQADFEQRQLTRGEIFLKICSLLSQEFKIVGEKIKLESRFREDLNLDSVDTIRVIMVLEEGFCLDIPDDDADNVLTVAEAVDYIVKRLREV